MNKKLKIPREKIAAFCKQHHIQQLSIFGSALREDFSPGSDIDVLVEFEKGYEPGFEFFDMQAELSNLLGYKVDLNTPQFLSRYFRDTVIQQAEVQYVQR
jgi:hypothetical protein